MSSSSYIPGIITPENYQEEFVTDFERARGEDLIVGDSKPLTGFEIHFLKCHKGLARPLTPKERALLDETIGIGIPTSDFEKFEGDGEEERQLPEWVKPLDLTEYNPLWKPPETPYPVKQILYELECEQAESDESIGLDAFGNDSDDRHTALVLAEAAMYEHQQNPAIKELEEEPESEPDDDPEFEDPYETLTEDSLLFPDRYRS